MSEEQKTISIAREVARHPIMEAARKVLQATRKLQMGCIEGDDVSTLERDWLTALSTLEAQGRESIYLSMATVSLDEVPEINEEREVKILERLIQLMDQRTLLCTAQSAAQQLSSALKDYRQGLSDVTETNVDDVVAAVGIMSVWINVLSLMLDDPSKWELAHLESIDRWTKRMVDCYIDAAREIAAAEETVTTTEDVDAETEEPAGDEAEDGVATMDEPEERVVPDGKCG